MSPAEASPQDSATIKLNFKDKKAPFRVNKNCVPYSQHINIQYIKLKHRPPPTRLVKKLPCFEIKSFKFLGIRLPYTLPPGSCARKLALVFYNFN